MTPLPSEPTPQPLPAEVVAALEQGQTIEAIKRLRTATGLGLKEAKEAIDRHHAGTAGRPRPSIAAAAALPFSVASAMMQGNKLEAIRLLREQGGSTCRRPRRRSKRTSASIRPPTAIAPRARYRAPRAPSGWS